MYVLALIISLAVVAIFVASMAVGVNACFRAARSERDEYLPSVLRVRVYTVAGAVLAIWIVISVVSVVASVFQAL